MDVVRLGDGVKDRLDDRVLAERVGARQEGFLVVALPQPPADVLGVVSGLNQTPEPPNPVGHPAGHRDARADVGHAPPPAEAIPESLENRKRVQGTEGGSGAENQPIEA